jgi:hypothetical protein
MIKWEGKGEPALTPETVVRVKLRSGSAGCSPMGAPVSMWDWTWEDKSEYADIVEYEVVLPHGVTTESSALPKDAAARKAIPVYSGFIAYFPDAICAVAELSRIGNDQHTPGKPLHWDRSKSGDELDAEMRHMIDGVTTEVDTDGVLHKTKKAWRAMADLQKALEARRK